MAIPVRTLTRSEALLRRDPTIWRRHRGRRRAKRWIVRTRGENDARIDFRKKPSGAWRSDRTGSVERSGRRARRSARFLLKPGRMAEHQYGLSAGCRRDRSDAQQSGLSL